jgi:integrase
VSTGIEARHARTCASHPRNGGGSCNCKPTFQAQVYDKHKRRPIKRTFATKTAAKRWRQDALVAMRAGDLSADRGPLLNDALDRWLDALQQGVEQTRSGDPFKPGTIRDYERCIRSYGVRDALGHHRVREVRTADVQRWIDRLVTDGKLAPATIDTALTPLRAFYRRALVRGEAGVNPTLGIMKPAVRCKVRRVVSPAQACAMLDALDGHDARVWAIAFYAGLRRGELIGLRREDIDLATGLIHVCRGWDMLEGEVPPKSRQGKRKVPIPAVLRDYLDADALSEDGLLFGAPHWIAKTNERARKVWEARGLPVLTLHEARHTFASLMIAAGVNAKALSGLMGHANISITLDLYGHLLPGSEDEAAALLDGYLARAVGGSTVARTVAHPEEVPV